jgi:histidine triad (HIT) family protein
LTVEDCIFCKIVAGQIRSSRIYEDELVLAFEDINPMAPVHVIVVPKRHVATLLDIGEGDKDLLAAMTAAAQKIARRRGIAERGFRTVVNCNEEGGQVIFHLHMHVLGGRKLLDELG